MRARTGLRTRLRAVSPALPPAVSVAPCGPTRVGRSVTRTRFLCQKTREMAATVACSCGGRGPGHTAPPAHRAVAAAQDGTVAACAPHRRRGPPPRPQQQPFGRPSREARMCRPEHACDTRAGVHRPDHTIEDHIAAVADQGRYTQRATPACLQAAGWACLHGTILRAAEIALQTPLYMVCGAYLEPRAAPSRG
jgi:hypothetical protein